MGREAVRRRSAFAFGPGGAGALPLASILALALMPGALAQTEGQGGALSAIPRSDDSYRSAAFGAAGDWRPASPDGTRWRLSDDTRLGSGQGRIDLRADSLSRALHPRRSGVGVGPSGLVTNPPR